MSELLLANIMVTENCTLMTYRVSTKSSLMIKLCDPFCSQSHNITCVILSIWRSTHSCNINVDKHLKNIRVLHINVLSQDRCTALMQASWNGHVGVVDALINSKANVDAADKVCEK